MKELVILGTSAQVPTRERNHNGYFLKWEDEGILFDPGEGTQRQMTFADVATSDIDRVAMTHFHGDHCLGFPGVVQRFCLDKVGRDIDVFFPSGGGCYYESLMRASLFQSCVNFRACPVEGDGVLMESRGMRLYCGALEHRAPCFGYRVEEPAARTVCMGRLAEYGIAEGVMVGRLKREGRLKLDDGREILLEDVSVERPGQSFAIVMDTRPCEGALALARGVDVLLCEATYLDSEERQAYEYMHMTARQAAVLAREAGVKKLVLSHFSQRYLHLGDHLAQAREVFPNTVVAHDLDRIVFERRVRGGDGVKK